MIDKNDPTKLFWDIAEQLLLDVAVTKGKLMGFPCLRVDGNFFATSDHRTGGLIVKLSEKRVQELIKKEVGQPFAPAGRTFREWTLITERNISIWESLMVEAKGFAECKGAK